ncbi:MAG TPA: phosphoenolpyruvate synthase [Dehalococcoidia bacterium]|nr:phosphoenolpyruvate synthase [Dehalococcoidia bacterium]
MTEEGTIVLELEEIDASSLPVVGGKGANLGELLRAGFQVPAAFVVGVEGYRRFIQQGDTAAQIEASIAGLDPEDSAATRAAALRAQQVILSTPIPASVETAIRVAYRELGGGLVAVRSSATAEDLPDASFAGQQSTFLNMEGEDEVVDAVHRCWASLFEARAIYYRAQGSWKHEDLALAVVVQQMIQADTAGVMFTVDPTTNDPTCIVIEAVLGLGEAAVSGAVTPDHYVVNKQTGEIREQQIGTQTEELIRTAAANGRTETRWEPVAESRRSFPKLTPALARELGDLGRRIEAHYGGPQDIEWARAGNAFYLLQARPVTTANTGFDKIGQPPPLSHPPILTGAAASPGVASGRVRIIHDDEGLPEVAPGDILVAGMTTPDFVPAMRRAAAIVTDHGGRTCHAAIVSRELGVPCVVGTGEATALLAPGALITVDGCEGRVCRGEEPELLDWWDQQRRQLTTDEAPPTETRIYVNLANPEVAPRVAAQAIDGVGLLRAEFIIAQMGSHPRLFLEEGRPQEFVELLRAGVEEIARAFVPRPVVYRASDFKTNEYRRLRGGDQFEPTEANPMLGYRGAIRYIREPELFALEMEAIKQVVEHCGNVNLMIPFVRTPSELRQVVRMVEAAGLKRGPHFKLWMMVEVPSNVLILDAFIDEGIDGVSIGSNDLTQLVLGIDRDSETLADSFDERNAAVLEAIGRTIEVARRRDVTVSICGQGPSEHPEFAEWLVARGITSVSVTPDVVDATRRAVAAAEVRLRGS